MCKNDKNNKFEINEEIIFEEIQDGPQEEPILVPIEYDDKEKTPKK